MHAPDRGLLHAVFRFATRQRVHDAVQAYPRGTRSELPFRPGPLHEGVHATLSVHVRDGQLIHPSDLCSARTASGFANRLAQRPAPKGSASAGNSNDNALVEDLLWAPRTELVQRKLRAQRLSTAREPPLRAAPFQAFGQGMAHSCGELPVPALRQPRCVQHAGYPPPWARWRRHGSSRIPRHTVHGMQWGAHRRESSPPPPNRGVDTAR